MAAPPQSGRVDELEARIASLEEEARAREYDGLLASWASFVRVSGLLQPQLVLNAAPSGTLPLMGPPAREAGEAPGDPAAAFRIRRARLRVTVTPSRATRLLFEFEPISSPAPIPTGSTVARRIEAQVTARWPVDVTTTVGAGMFPIPFGYELQQTDGERPFVERSWGARNMFARTFDTGMQTITRARGERFTFQSALVNGRVLGEPSFESFERSGRGFDWAMRAHYDFGAIDIGASGYLGRAEARGGAVPHEFVRWAANIEAALDTAIWDFGRTRAFFELTFGENMDRGLLYPFALPAATRDDGGVDTGRGRGPSHATRQASVFLRVEQELSARFALAARYDRYTPHAALERNDRATYAGVFVAKLGPRIQTMLEYDYARDRIRATGPVPPVRHVHAGALTLQARF